MWHESWPSREIQNLNRALGLLECLVKDQASADDPDVASALAKFLLVRTCGHVEQIVEQCCRAYLQSKSEARVASFGENWLGRGANPRPEKLINLVQRFDVVWSQELSELLHDNDELLSRELSFLVDRRNRIAHGLNEGVGVRKALDLVAPAIEVSEWFILRFDPT